MLGPTLHRPPAPVHPISPRPILDSPRSVGQHRNRTARDEAGKSSSALPVAEKLRAGALLVLLTPSKHQLGTSKQFGADGSHCALSLTCNASTQHQVLCPPLPPRLSSGPFTSSSCVATTATAAPPSLPRASPALSVCGCTRKEEAPQGTARHCPLHKRVCRADTGAIQERSQSIPSGWYGTTRRLTESWLPSWRVIRT